MRSKLMIFLLAMALLPPWSSPATSIESNCVRRDRQITLLEQLLDGPMTIERRNELVKGYDCKGLRIEFLRLSEVALALLENRKSMRLEKVLGATRIVETSPLQNYKTFLANFGRVYPAANLIEEMPYRESEEEKYQPFADIRLLFEPPIQHSFLELSPYFPAVDDISSLSSGTWPKSLKLFATEGATPGSLTLRQSTQFPPTLWRSLSVQDLLSFNENARRIGELAGRYGEANWSAEQNRLSEFGFLISASAGNLPEELIRIQGWPATIEEGCALEFVPTEISSVSPRLFLFKYKMPQLYFDAMLVRNATKEIIEISGFSGTKEIGAGLRRIDRSEAVSPDVDDLSGKVFIDPGATTIFPTAVLLRPQELDPCCQYVPAGESRAIKAIEEYARVGYGVGKDQYQTPSYPLYFQLLPAYSIGGLESSRGKFSFERTRPLRFSFAAALEGGSCPYLMTKSGTSEATSWVDHGKILHAATSRLLKTTQIERISGAPRFLRIEEREPEEAVIDMVKLKVSYEDGSTAIFFPDLKPLRHVDGDELHIRWGEALEFSFPVSDSPDRRSPKSSELEFVGYYERFDFTLLSGTPVPPRRDAAPGPITRVSNMTPYVAEPRKQKCGLGVRGTETWPPLSRRLPGSLFD